MSSSKFWGDGGFYRPLATLISLTLLLLCGTPIAFAEPEPLPIKVLHHTDETDATLARMTRGLSTIPLDVQKQIAGAGISVVLTPLMTYDEPDRSGEKVFREGGTTENIGGLFEQSKLRVIVPERASWRNGAPRSMGDYMIKVMRHELGHAWDSSQGWASQNAGFLAAYDQDFSKLSNEQCRSLAYVITGVATGDANVPTTSGHHECFAEAFAALTTPRSSWGKSEQNQMAGFPKVAEYLQTLSTGLVNPPREVSVASAAKIASSSSASRTSAAAQNKGTTGSVAGGTSPSSSAAGSENSADNESATSNIQFERGSALFKQQQYAQAIMFLDQSVKENPKNGKAFMLRGTAQMWLKKYNLAVQDYSTYIRLHPNDSNGYELRARAYLYLGQKAASDADMANARSAH